MAVTGKMTVDLYGNTHPFVQSMKAADDAAKKSGGSIADSIEKINAKQLNNAASGFIKNFVGPVGATELGLKVAADLISGFSKGIYKDVGDVAEAFAGSFAKSIASVPVAGAAYEVGTAVGNWAFGVDEANESLEESKKKLEEIGKFYKSMTDRKNLGESVTGGIVKQAEQLGMSPEQKARADALTKLETTGSVEGTTKEDFIKTQMDLYDQATEKVKNFNENQAIDKKYKDDLIAAQTALSQLESDAHKIDMSARDIKLEQLASMDGMTIAMLEQAMAAWDQLEAEKVRVIAQKELDNAKEKSAKEDLERIKKIKDAEIKAKQDARDEAIKAYEDYQEAQDVFAKTAEELDKKAAGVSATTSVDTAIGSVKIAGASDFSVQKEIDIAQSTLKEAKNQSDYLKSIDESLHKLGGTT
jgi:hypothetical protein